MSLMPTDWALYQTYLAGELVYDSYMSRIYGRPVNILPTGALDVDTCIALEQLANVMATAYQNPSMSSAYAIGSELAAG
jgi:hypothetical protein